MPGFRAFPIDSATRCGVAARKVATFLLAATAVLLCIAGPACAAPDPEHPFEILPGSFRVTPSTYQAGAHEDLTTSFDFAHSESTGETDNDLRTTVVNLPAGFVGNNTAVPACPIFDLLGGGNEEGSRCPLDTQVGTISLDLALGDAGPVKMTFPIFNLQVSSFGTTAELGFNATALSEILDISVRPEDDGLTVTAPDLTGLGEPHDVSTTIWGVPADPSHDAERGRQCYAIPGGDETEAQCYGGDNATDSSLKPFLATPTSCSTEPLRDTMEADAWEESESWSKAITEIAPMVECERVPFNPSIEVQPSTNSAESPTGLAVSLIVPQSWEHPEAVATANLKDATVTLPPGFTVNPSAGSGLGACTPAQYESETAQSLPGEGCPPESKIGSIEIETPVLAEKVSGAIYIATPYDNVPEFGSPEHPDGSLLALYVVAKDPARGVLIKVAGKLEPNPVTGQLVSTFLNNPQQPFSKFTLKFRPGATAPLVSPPACGTYTTQAALTPWSAPLEPRLLGSSFEITKGVHEGACPSGGVPPFDPQIVSGTQNNDAGAYSPFYLRIVREDGEQELTKFTTILPPGLTGNLSGIPFCPDAAIEASKQLTGAQEEAEPSCSTASEIGHTVVEAGVGTVLAQTPGKIYLAGPYHGAPLSIVSITSARVGPFDLGTVVIRFALDINPITAQVEVSGAQSDPIPHIIKGIVVHVRDIRVYMDRHDFTLNPTNCAASSISEAITGAGANPADPADQMSVPATAPFQAADCSSLQFKPQFRVSTQGKTSGANGASLTAKLTYPSAPLGTQVNIKSVKVELPKQLPSRLTTLQKACTAKVFDVNPGQCPAASLIGSATATTPLIPVPLSGPAYFVSNGTAKFPELIIVLQGYGFTIDLHGETFISKTGVTSTTFATVPDQPIGSFELTLPEGPYSALTSNANLCTHKLLMPTIFTAQNGQVIRQTTKVAVTGCPKAKGAMHKKKHTKSKKVGKRHKKKGKDKNKKK